VPISPLYPGVPLSPLGPRSPGSPLYVVESGRGSKFFSFSDIVLGSPGSPRSPSSPILPTNL